MVATSVLLESFMIVTLSAARGVVLALLYSRNLITVGWLRKQRFTNFVIPVSTIVLIVVATVISAAPLNWITAHKTGSMAIAEARRYEFGCSSQVSANRAEAGLEVCLHADRRRQPESRAYAFSP